MIIKLRSKIYVKLVMRPVLFSGEGEKWISGLIRHWPISDGLKLSPEVREFPGLTISRTLLQFSTETSNCRSHASITFTEPHFGRSIAPSRQDGKP